MRAIRARGRVLADGTVELRTDEPMEPGEFDGLLVLEGDARLRAVPADPDILRRLEGCLNLGGDAVEDTEALYDHA